MKHLTLEMLARLVDESASPAEQEHLVGCTECKRALHGLRAQTEHLGALPALVPPRGDWRELEARLVSEGLVQRRGNVHRLTQSLSSGWIRTAAAAAIFAAGAVTGSAVTESSTSSNQAVPSAALAPVDNAANLGEAEGAVRLAEQQYARSLLTYRRLLGQGQQLPGDDPIRREQALELLVQAGQSAVRAAPDDPYINSFLVNVLAERRASSRRARAGDNWF